MEKSLSVLWQVICAEDKMNKRKELEEYCEYRGWSDQCEGCPLKEFGNCQFNVLTDDEIERMYEKLKEVIK